MAKGRAEAATPAEGAAPESAHGFPQGESFDAAASKVADLLRTGAVPSRVGRDAPSTLPDQSDDFADQLEAAVKGGAPKAPAAEMSEKLNLAGIAERLGISMEDVYKLEVGMPDDGSTLTLTELKDLATERKRDVAERLEWETTQASQRNQIAAATAELQTLLGMLPAEMRTPDMIRQAQAKLEYTRGLEQQKLLQRVPEWRDPAQFEADFEAIRPHVAEWGFSDADLAGVYDSRLLAYIRHNALREKRLGELLEQTRKQRERRGSPRTTGGKPDSTIAPQRRGSNRDAKVEAITNLLRNGT
jgi:hypothetical protein